MTHVLKRGNPEQQGPAAEPGFPAVLSAKRGDQPRPTARSSGRRLWLARWLSSPENPLAARVIANRVWQFHFGRGIVGSANDLGVMGDEPTHPELLDWLASELISGGWRLKPLHRQIVLSETYQRSARLQAQAAKVDPDDTMLWRHRGRRLEAEVVRDSILAVSGRLNTKLNGPGFYPTLPAAVLAGQSVPGEGWGKSDEHEQSPAQHLYLRQAQPGSAGNRAARRAGLHEQLRAANRLDNRAAGAGVLERGVHPRTSAALRDAAGRGSRRPAGRSD